MQAAHRRHRSTSAAGLCLAVVTSVATSVAPGTQPAVAEESINACIEAVGTFLTENSLPHGQAGTLHSRSLISLTNGGHAFRTDSDENTGLAGVGFGDGRGAWRCDGVEGDYERISATVLNFSYGDIENIARTDYKGTFHRDSGELHLEGTLGFVKLHDDPWADDALKDGIPIEVVGVKIQAPK